MAIAADAAYRSIIFLNGSEDWVRTFASRFQFSQMPRQREGVSAELRVPAHSIRGIGAVGCIRGPARIHLSEGLMPCRFKQIYFFIAIAPRTFRN